MKTMKMYASYGELAHEKKVVFSEGHGEIFDTVVAELPEGWDYVELVVGHGLESPWGEICLINEAIKNIGGDPWIDVCNVSTGEVYRKKLKIVGGSYKGNEV